jgi:hypothetical protein
MIGPPLKMPCADYPLLRLRLNIIAVAVTDGRVPHRWVQA